MKLILKKILIGILGLAAVFLVLTAVTFGWEAWKSYKWQKSVDEFQERLEKPYREDTYGGAAPEETWVMFLGALRAGDIELASKYFAVEKQEEYKEILEKTKQENKLNEWIKEMEGLKKSEREALKGQLNYYYDYFDQEFNQVLSSPVIFYLNPLTKVWKILVL